VSEASLPAPAKLNLFLHVTGRRADGYHELQTVFQFLDLCDRLHLRVRDDGRILRTAELAGVPPERDLTLRAARLLQAETGTPAGAEVRLLKRLPAGGGLGGGSSDAATALVGLNSLWGLGLDEDALAELGLRLGADVPVFVRGRAAWAEGVGERLTPVPLQEPWYLVVQPPVHVSTAQVFACPELTRDTPPTTIRRFFVGAAPLSVRELMALTRNDLEAAVRLRHPEVGEALGRLAAWGPARMTGSGGCVFLPCETQSAARALLARLPPELPGFVARGRNRSPLRDAVPAG
jgi:4-diphosphocytidyl-2-C-methyl-D-erythritol kinase